MPGISDSKHPDDVRIHLELILSADERRSQPEAGENESDARSRASVRLPTALRERTQAAFELVKEAAPGLSAVEVAKLSTSRAGRTALQEGREALARVDSHLISATGERNPVIGRSYGVFGLNPSTFAGVYRALFLAETENTRLGALPESASERALLFTPLIADAVRSARVHLQSLLGERVASRAELSRQVALKDELQQRARACISAVRNHLYANLPRRKRDPDLRDYGFRPIARRSNGSTPEGEEGGEVEQEREA